jgi:hypothetical protein
MHTNEGTNAKLTWNTKMLTALLPQGAGSCSDDCHHVYISGGAVLHTCMYYIPAALLACCKFLFYIHQCVVVLYLGLPMYDAYKRGTK